MSPIHVQPGELYLSRGEERLETVLGSCVSLCVHDPELKLGGMNHFVLPDRSYASRDSDVKTKPYRFGEFAIPELLKRMKQAGARRQRLKCSVLGGAEIEKRTQERSIGRANIEYANAELQRFNLKAHKVEVGGQLGRKICFDPESGEIWLRKIQKGSEPEPDEIELPQTPCDPRLRSQIVLGIGASTGGTEAVLKLLSALPQEMPPILIVQHMPEGFTEAFAKRLDEACALRVKEAEHGDVLEAGHAYLAPGGSHLKVYDAPSSPRLQLTEEAPVQGFRPSVDVLFNSLARLELKRPASVLLTGMGKDGAAGSLCVKNSGGLTFAESEESSLIFGMPREAIRCGGIHHVLHLSEMPEKLIYELNQWILKRRSA